MEATVIVYDKGLKPASKWFIKSEMLLETKYKREHKWCDLNRRT